MCDIDWSIECCWLSGGRHIILNFLSRSDNPLVYSDVWIVCTLDAGRSIIGFDFGKWVGRIIFGTDNPTSDTSNNSYASRTSLMSMKSRLSAVDMHLVMMSKRMFESVNTSSRIERPTMTCRSRLMIKDTSNESQNAYISPTNAERTIHMLVWEL